MRDRLRKKAEKRKREQIHRLLDLALDINGLGVRKQAITGNLPTAFFYDSGHTASIDVHVHSRGWCIDDVQDKKVSAYTDKAGGLERAVCQLKEIKAETPGAATPRESR